MRGEVTSLRVQRSIVQIMNDICDALDRPVPKCKKSKSDIQISLGKTDILKFPPTKNWRPMIKV